MFLSNLKQAQRQSLLRVRRQLPEWFQEKCSKQVCEHLMDLSVYQQAKRIALYRSFNREICLDMLWHDAVRQGKTCYFPVLKKQCLAFVAAMPQHPFGKNRLGVLEPLIQADTRGLPGYRTALQGFTALSQIDSFILPLVGFDAEGHRLGMGGGYYDRTLAEVEHVTFIGVGYAFQQLKRIPSELTDVSLHVMVTEHGVLTPNKGL